MMRSGVAVLLVAWCAWSPAGAGVVRTLDGKVLRGDVKAEADRLVVTSGGKTTAVALDEVMHADLLAASPSTEPAADAPIDAFGEIRQWIATDVGNTRHPGKTIFEGNRVVLRGAGMDIAYREDTTRDDFYFYHRPLPADGQIVAKVNSFTQDGRSARVGVMLRAGLDPQAPHAMLGLTGTKWCFQFRAKPRDATQREEQGGAEGECWLKLTRRGTRITAFGSRDGNEWKPMGSCEGLPSGKLLVGLAVASRQPEKMCTAVLQDVSVTASNSAAETQPPEPMAVVERGIVLRDGTRIPGEVRLADDSVVRFAPSGQKERSFPAIDVSRVLFRSVKSGAEMRDPDAPGAILRNGDFVDGDVRAIRDSTVRVNSVLFGLRTLHAGDVAQVVLRPAETARLGNAVVLRDGSTYSASAVQAGGSDLKLQTAVLGAVSVPWDSVREIRAAGGRLVPLASVEVVHAAEAAHVVDGVPGDLEAKVAGRPLPRGSVGVPAGATLFYELDGKHRAFMASVGVPEGVAGGTRLRFVVVADGKELWKSEPMTALDPPATLTVALAGVKRLELKVVNEGRSRGVAAGVWMEGFFAPVK